MISPNHLHHESRNAKNVHPLSPNLKRKNIQYALQSPLPATMADHLRKDAPNSNPNPSSNPLSPNSHYYHHQKMMQKSTTFTRDEYPPEPSSRDLLQKISKLNQKINQHESILIKLTENSLENNKEEYKRSHLFRQENGKWLQPVNQSIQKLKKQFQEFKTHSFSQQQGELNTQFIDERISKSQKKMKQQLDKIILSVQNQPTPQDQRLEQLQKTIKKHEKMVALNTSQISSTNDKIQSISTSIDGHMDLINAEVNKAINKIVNFVNQKVSKPLTDNIEQITHKLQALDSEMKTQALPTASHFGNLKSSTLKSPKEMTRAQYRQILTAYGQQIIISQNTYYIDSQGYLLDSQYFYLIHNEQKVRLDERQIRLLMHSQLMD